MQVDIPPPPPSIPEISRGYAAAQPCRPVLDPLDFAQCENDLSSRYKDEGAKSPDFLLGYTIAVFAGADRIEQALEAAPPSPRVDQNMTVVTNVGLAGVLAVETAAKKDGVTAADIPTLVFRMSGVSQDRWTYWRSKPRPDWLSKQLKP